MYILSKLKITVSKHEKYDLAYVLAVSDKCTKFKENIFLF